MLVAAQAGWVAAEGESRACWVTVVALALTECVEPPTVILIALAATSPSRPPSCAPLTRSSANRGRGLRYRQSITYIPTLVLRAIKKTLFGAIYRIKNFARF